MKKRILYSILNEWRDEDIEDFPLDLDDVDFEPTSSNMSDEPDLKDVDFELSTLHSQYEYFPKTRDELKEIVDMEIEKQGGVNVNLNMIDTSKITDMSTLFYFCKSLETLDINKWDVSNVENMSCMFQDCYLLHSLDVSGWNVLKVWNMSCMFHGCKSLRNLDIRGWDVSNVERMFSMFSKCQSLKTLDISGWKVSKVMNMEYMFKNCKSLHTDTREWKINTKNTRDMYINAPNIEH